MFCVARVVSGPCARVVNTRALCVLPSFHSGQPAALCRRTRPETFITSNMRAAVRSGAAADKACYKAPVRQL